MGEKWLCQTEMHWTCSTIKLRFSFPIIEWNQGKLLIIKVDLDESIIHYLLRDCSLSSSIFKASQQQKLLLLVVWRLIALFWVYLIICNNEFVQFENCFCNGRRSNYSQCPINRDFGNGTKSLFSWCTLKFAGYDGP